MKAEKIVWTILCDETLDVLCHLLDAYIVVQVSNWYLPTCKQSWKLSLCKDTNVCDSFFGGRVIILSEFTWILENFPMMESLGDLRLVGVF